MLGRFAAITVALVVLAVPTASAATTDIATAQASPGPYLANAPIVFTSTTQCTVSCRLIWTYLSGTRLGEKLGEGTSVSRAFSTPGLKTVELRLTELCAGTTRLVCASQAYVSVLVADVPAIVDSTAPTFTASGLEAEATGPDTVVTYTFAATDPDDSVIAQSCAPAPGSAFPVGSTRIDCSAVDSNGNVGTASFAVVVSDTTAPVLSVPSGVSQEATSAAGAPVGFTVGATDLVDGPLTPSCSRLSGSSFPLGSTTVDCTVSDAHHNSSSASFTVTVTDTTPPVVVVPAPITVEATSPAGASVTYSATAHDVVDGPVTPSCSVASGSTFAIGQTLVRCTASDSHHNAGSATFAVNVVDTRAPVLTVPSQVSADATSPAGAVVAYSAVATDAAGGAVAVACAPPSGAVFPIGNTTVQCKATDGRGNASAAQTFVVHVRGAGEQLAEVVAQVERWNLKGGGLQERLQTAAKALAKSSSRGCAALSEITSELGDSDRRLTAAQRSWLRGALTRIQLVLACTPERGDGKGHEDEGRKGRE